MAFTGFNYTLPSDYRFLTEREKLIEVKKWRYEMGQMLIEYLKSINEYKQTTESGKRLIYRLAIKRFLTGDNTNVATIKSAGDMELRCIIYIETNMLTKTYDILKTIDIPVTLLNISNFGSNDNTDTQAFINFIAGLDSSGSTPVQPSQYIRRNIGSGTSGEWTHYITVYPNEFVYKVYTNFDKLNSTQKNNEKIKFKEQLDLWVKNYLITLGLYDSTKKYKLASFNSVASNYFSAKNVNTSGPTNTNLYLNRLLDQQSCSNETILSVTDVIPNMGYIGNVWSMNAPPMCFVISEYSATDTFVKNVITLFPDEIKLLNGYLADFFEYTLRDCTYENPAIIYNAFLPETNSGATLYNTGFIYAKSLASVNDLTLDLATSINTTTLTDSQKKQYAESIINKLKDFIINKLFKTYNIFQNQKIYCAIECRKIVVVSTNYGTGSPSTGAGLHLVIFTDSSRTNILKTIALHPNMITQSAIGNDGLTTEFKNNMNTLNNSNTDKTSYPCYINTTIEFTDIFKFLNNNVYPTYTTYDNVSQLRVGSWSSYSGSDWGKPAYTRFNIMIDGRQYVGNPSLFLKPAVNIPSGEYRRDEFPLVTLTNQSPSMHSFPRKYNTLNNKPLNNTSDVSRLYDNTILKDNELIVYQSKSTNNNIFLKINLNTLTFKEQNLLGGYIPDNWMSFDKNIKIFTHKGNIYGVGRYGLSEETRAYLTGKSFRFDFDNNILIPSSKGIYTSSPDLNTKNLRTFGLSHLSDVLEVTGNILYAVAKTSKHIIKIIYTGADYLNIGNYESHETDYQSGLNHYILVSNLEFIPYNIAWYNSYIYGLHSSKILLLNTLTNSISYLDSPRIRNFGTIIVKNNIIYLIGGLGEDNEPLFCIDQYDIEKGIWLDPWDYTSAIKIEDRPSYKIQSKWVNIPGTSKYVQIHKELEGDNTCISYMEIAKPTVMYYTTDGSDPKDKNNLNRVKYTGPFNIKPSGTKTTTVKVRAYTDIE